MKSLEHLRTPRSKMGFMNPLAAQESSKLFFRHRGGLQDHLEFLLSAPILGSSARHSRRHLVMNRKLERTGHSGLSEPSGQGRLRYTHFLTQRSSRQSSWAAHPLHYFFFKPLRVSHVNPHRPNSVDMEGMKNPVPRDPHGGPSASTLQVTTILSQGGTKSH